jgi:hypothetical protein
MSNLQTLMVADSMAWFESLNWFQRLMGHLFGVLSVYRQGYIAGVAQGYIFRHEVEENWR